MVQERRKNGHPEPYKVNWWGIGNESWGCGGNMTPEYYADVYKRYATFTHDYPGTPLKRIVSGANADGAHWTEVCMQNIGPDRMWGLTLHYYTLPTGNPGPQKRADPGNRPARRALENRDRPPPHLGQRERLQQLRQARHREAGRLQRRQEKGRQAGPDFAAQVGSNGRAEVSPRGWAKPRTT